MDKEKLEYKANVLDFPVCAELHFRRAVDAYQKGDIDLALKEAELSLNAGEGHANALLGKIYENTNIKDCTNYQNALFYYEQGVRTVGALECWLGVARLNYLGLGMNKNYSKAFDCYNIIAEDSGHPIADLMLGKMYLDGEGVEKNYSMALSYLQSAESKGLIFAKSYLGTLYLRNGAFFKGIWYRLTAALHGLLLSFCENGKRRLRRI